MKLKTILIGVGALLAIAIGFVAVVASQIDPNAYRDYVAEQIRGATGRSVELAGPLRLEYGLRPAVAAEDVRIANFAGGSRPQMATIRRFEAQVELIPLLFGGTIRITRVALEGADVVLETDAAGRGNWLLPATQAVAGQAPSSGQRPPALPEIDELTIRDSTFTIRDRRLNRATSIALSRMVLRGGAGDSPVRIQIELRQGDVPFALEGTFGSLPGLFADAAWPVDATVRVGEAIRGRVQGNITQPMGAGRFDLAFTGESAEMSRLGPLLGMTLPQLGPFTANARLGGNLAAPSLAALSVQAGRAETVQLRIEGAIGDLVQRTGLDLRVNFEGRELGALNGLRFGATAMTVPSLGPYRGEVRIGDNFAARDIQFEAGSEQTVRVQLAGRISNPLAARGIAIEAQVRAADAAAAARLMGVESPVRGALNFQGRLTDPLPQRYLISGMRLVFGATEINGDFSVSLSGRRPSYSGDLTSPRIDLVALGLARPRGGPAPRAQGRVFSAEPLPFEALNLADAEIHLRVAALDGGPLPLRNVNANITLRGGEMTVRQFMADVADGRIGGDISAARTGRVDIRLEGRGINAGEFLRNMGVSDRLDGGRAEVNIAVRSNGASLRAIMAGLNGTATVIVRDGVVDNRFLELIGADMLRWFSGLVRGESRPRLNCYVSRFDFTNGLAAARVLMFDTSQITVAGDGTINLGNEQLALRMVPRPKEASLISIAVPVRVGGTLANPSAVPTPDAELVGRIAGGAAGIALLGPLGLALGLAQPGSRDPDPCVAATAQAQGRAAPQGGPAPAQRPGQAAPPSRNPIDQFRGLFNR